MCIRDSYPEAKVFADNISLTYNPVRPRVVYLKNLVDDRTGNNNNRLDPNEQANLLITLKNIGLNATGVSGRLRALSNYVEIRDSLATYGNMAQGDTAINTSDPFTVYARSITPIGTQVTFALIINYDGKAYADTENFKLTVGDMTTLSIPDNRYRYWAYDDIDIDPQHPTYNWLEIKNIGTPLILGDDQTVTIPLPFGFNYYGTRYDSISICTNGWIAAGTTTLNSNLSYPIPDPHGPPAMIAPNWCDLFADSNNFLWYHYDQTNHRFVIEYDSLVYYASTLRDKFEVIIFDSTLTTPTGDNVIIFQFQTANRYRASSIGIEDQSQTVGIQDFYREVHHKYAAPIISGRAIKFTTARPVGVEEEIFTARKNSAIILTACPNPIAKSTTIKYIIRKESCISLKVYDIGGRLVKTLHEGHSLPGYYDIVWRADDEHGQN